MAFFLTSYASFLASLWVDPLVFKQSKNYTLPQWSPKDFTLC